MKIIKLKTILFLVLLLSIALASFTACNKLPDWILPNDSDSTDDDNNDNKQEAPTDNEYNPEKITAKWNSIINSDSSGVRKIVIQKGTYIGNSSPSEISGNFPTATLDTEESVKSFIGLFEENSISFAAYPTDSKEIEAYKNSKTRKYIFKIVFFRFI